MLEISIMDASVTILPFSYVVDIYVLRKNIFIYYMFIYYTHVYIFIHMVAIMRILWWGCMQTTVFITPLNFNFSEKNLMLLINIFHIESFSCYKMMTDISKTSVCSKKMWYFYFKLYQHDDLDILRVTLNAMILFWKARLGFDYVWLGLCRNKCTVSFRIPNIK